MHWDTVIPALEAFLLSRVMHPAWGGVAGYLGGILILVSLFKTTMIPLRAVGAASNLCFVAYGYLDGVYPMMLLHAALFPLNVVRLCQMVKLVRRVRSAAEGGKTLDWLRPYMRRRFCRARAVIFHKNDIADSMFYTVSGHFRLSERGLELPVGAFVGEFGLLTPDGRRTQTLECTEDGELLVIGYDQVKMLYFQNPDFGFYFMKLVTGRLFQNLSTLEQCLNAANARNSEPGVLTGCDETAVSR